MKNQAADQCKRIFVLDTSAFVAGFDPFSLTEEQVTVPKVEAEIRTNSMIKTRFETAVESGRLKVKTPSEEFSKKIKALANKVGDSFKLSDADMQLLALTLEMKESGFNPQIVTDDYSIQNVASRTGIEFLALATFGIKRLIEWVRYCPACHTEYPPDYIYKECEVCGTMLERKPRRTARMLNTR
jgi:UPF0271 protein